jgi:hypothetical protein
MQTKNAAGFSGGIFVSGGSYEKVKMSLLAGYQRHRPACGCARSHEISVGGSVVHLITSAERIR